MSNMIYKSEVGDLDLSKVVRLYPAVVIEMDGEVAQMSLDWIKDNADKVNVKHFVLVFDFRKNSKDEKNKTTLVFNSKEELDKCMIEIGEFF